MNNAFIIGNGVSRKSIDLTRLNGVTYGCNAIYRDFTPDYLVAVDPAMIEEILNSTYPKERLIIRSHPAIDAPTVRKLKWRDSCSGISALRLALQEDYEKIVLIGFDLWGINSASEINNRGGVNAEISDSGQRTVNNIYADTENYRSSQKSEVRYQKWINQLEQYATEGKVVRILGKESLPLKDLKIDRELGKIASYYV